MLKNHIINHFEYEEYYLSNLFPFHYRYVMF